MGFSKRKLPINTTYFFSIRNRKSERSRSIAQLKRDPLLNTRKFIILGLKKIYIPLQYLVQNYKLSFNIITIQNGRISLDAYSHIFKN